MGKSDSAFRKHPAAVRALTVCGIAASVAGAGATAWAADMQGARPDLSRLGRMELYPLAGSSLNPLSNSVDTNLSGMPLSTGPVSSMLQNGLPVSTLPVVGGLLNQGSSSS